MLVLLQLLIRSVWHSCVLFIYFKNEHELRYIDLSLYPTDHSLKTGTTKPWLAEPTLLLMNQQPLAVC